MAQDKVGYFRRPRRLRYGGVVQNVALVDSPAELADFAENEPGNVQRALWDRDLVVYNDQGQIVVDRENVKQAAQAPKAYYIDNAQQQAAATGRLISKKTAEQRVNRQEAAEAQAILLAARVGNVKITDAQSERLQKIADGGYLDLVYSQYKSAEQGTANLKVRERSAGNLTEGQREEQRLRFFEEVYRYGGRRKKARKEDAA